MYIPINYEKEFDELWNRLKEKYPAEIFNLEGIGKQLDLCDFSKTFFKSANVADNSADANSNVDDLTVVAYENELPKPWTRLNSLYLLWKYGKKLFGIEWANEAIEKEIAGEYYINDLSNVNKPYCYNFSTLDVMTKGLPFVRKIQSKPPKHLSSFVGQLIHFTSYASNQIMGAVGLADLLIVLSYYVRKELEENPGLEDYIWRQVKQEIQSLIYSCNQPFRGGLQSGFYNISIYDDEFLDSLIPNYIFPDGRYPDKELVKKLQDVYLDLMNETMDISPITFPVTTACFCVDENKNIKDEKFLEYIAKKNLKWAFINIYAGETSTLSSCCYSKDTQVLIKNDETGYLYIKDFEELKDYNEKYSIFSDGEWVKGELVILPNRPMFQVTLVNGATMKLTDNHRNNCIEGEKITKELSIDDYIMVSLYLSGNIMQFKNTNEMLIKDGNYYLKVKSIEPINYKDDVYCFSIDKNFDDKFTLANGIHNYNCRLRSKKNNEYLGYTNSFGGASTQIGSFGVVTLNLPHLALLSNGNEDVFFEKLKENVHFSIKLNHIKRYILQKRIGIGALPLYIYGFMDIKKQYATTGVNGLYECIRFLGKDILKEDGQELCKKILQTINGVNEEADKEYKYAHNLEQTPSENSAIKLAHKDQILGLQKEFELYSNQFIPLIVTANLLDRIRLQGMFDGEFSGGSIMHVGCDMRVENYENLMKMIKATVKAGVVYHAINYNLQKCEDGHMTVGNNANCSVCGKPITDNYVRVVGFIVNTKNFHKVRREVDYPNRQLYNKDDIESIGD